jgi:hypothetical protein
VYPLSISPATLCKTSVSFSKNNSKRMSSTDSDIEAVDVNSNPENQSEVERLQHESSNMIKLLKNLEKEEHDVHCQLQILAREALLCGFDPNLVEAPQPRRRRTTAATKKKAVASSSEVASETPSAEISTTMTEPIPTVTSEALAGTPGSS